MFTADIEQTASGQRAAQPHAIAAARNSTASAAAHATPVAAAR